MVVGSNPVKLDMMNNLLQKFLSYGENEYKSMRLGLDRTRGALESLGNPQDSFKSVLIAGTNGKGSVGRILESVLREAGLSVGFYSSPHLIEFNERIRVGGQEVPTPELEEVLTEFFQRGLLDEDGCLWTPKRERLTWFEKATVLAFEIFRRRGVALALIEVGLGGRFDATNVVDPKVSVITSISQDHTEVLGDSLFEIAREKAGVFRRGRPVVIGPMAQEVRDFLVKASRLEGAKPITPFSPQGTTEKFSYQDYSDLSLGLAGKHQLNNAASALETLGILKEEGFKISEEAIRGGISKASLPGRLEWWDGVLLDVAHNEESLGALVHYLEGQKDGREIKIVLGMMEEKNPGEALKVLSQLDPKYYFTEVKSPRSVTVGKWKELATHQQIRGEFFHHSLEALKKAQEGSNEQEIVVVTGSLYLVGEIRWLTRSAEL